MDSEQELVGMAGIGFLFFTVFLVLAIVAYLAYEIYAILSYGFSGSFKGLEGIEFFFLLAIVIASYRLAKLKKLITAHREKLGRSHLPASSLSFFITGLTFVLMIIVSFLSSYPSS